MHFTEFFLPTFNLMTKSCEISAFSCNQTQHIDKNLVYIFLKILCISVKAVNRSFVFLKMRNKKFFIQIKFLLDLSFILIAILFYYRIGIRSSCKKNTDISINTNSSFDNLFDQAAPVINSTGKPLPQNPVSRAFFFS